HGFVESLVADKGSMESAATFCANNPGVKIPRQECFHGIGHGVVDSNDAAAWKDIVSLRDRALSICRTIRSTDDEFMRCAGGVYNGIANAYWAGDYGTAVDPKAPFKVCESLAKSDRAEDCYSYMARIFLSGKWDLSQDIARAVSSAPPAYSRFVVGGVAIMFSGKKNSGSEARLACEALEGQQKDICLSQYALGISLSGERENSLKRAKEFCEALPIEEQSVCLSELPR